MGYWLVLIIGICGGAVVGIQSILARAVGQKIGRENIRDWRSLPWYMLGAGIFGLILYRTSNVTLLRVGGMMRITLIIIGQLSLGIVIDHFGLFGIVTRHIDLPRSWV